MAHLLFAFIPLLAVAQDAPISSPSPTPVAAAAHEDADGVVATDNTVAADSDVSTGGIASADAPTQGAFILSERAVNLWYLFAAILFIRGIKGLTHPRTAVRGNLMGAVGMLIAVVVTLFSVELDWWVIVAGLLVGGGVGAYYAVKVEMTGIPEMVALFNGFGGIASVFVAGAALFYEVTTTEAGVATVASGVIGSVTFFGSLVALFKLQNVKWMPNGAMVAGQNLLSVALLGLCVVLGSWMVGTIDPSTGVSGTGHFAYWLIFIVAGVLGVMLTQPIGGADMPVVIALLNSYSGLAACATGFVIGNSVLIIAGSLVGASGLILTSIMCKAMNRSLRNVVFGTMGPTADTPDAEEVYKTVKTASPEEVAMLFDTAQKAVIVPGYGMAVSQCQHAVRDLMNLLESRGCQVEFGVHPVAGRMPGHMNVLLAEANVDYDKLREMDDVNTEMEQFDVALVIGANDVVNPVARTDPNSPIAGMPIIDVDKARTCVVVKRSLSPGFAGIPNPLFAAENTLMMFGDGKKAILELIAAIKEG